MTWYMGGMDLPYKEALYFSGWVIDRREQIRDAARAAIDWDSTDEPIPPGPEPSIDEWGDIRPLTEDERAKLHTDAAADADMQRRAARDRREQRTQEQKQRAEAQPRERRRRLREHFQAQHRREKLESGQPYETEPSDDFVDDLPSYFGEEADAPQAEPVVETPAEATEAPPAFEPEPFRRQRPAGGKQCPHCQHMNMPEAVATGVCAHCGGDLGTTGSAPSGSGGGGAPGRGRQARGPRDILRDALSGGVWGGIAASLSGHAVHGLAAPLTEAVGIALESAGASGAGAQRIGRGFLSLFTAGLQSMATLGGSVLGGAMGAVVGGAAGSALGGLVGTVAGSIGGLFSEAGRSLGESLGGLAQIMQDTTRTVLQLSESVMKLSLTSGSSVDNANNLTTGLRALGVAPGAVQGMFGQRKEFQQMRMGALGIPMPHGDMDMDALVNVGEWLQRYPGMLRPAMAQAALGPGAQPIMAELMEPGQDQLRQAAEAAKELQPQTDALERAWRQLRIPVAEIGLAWDALKVSFAGSFIPSITTGIRTLTNLFTTHRRQIENWFSSLPDKVLPRLASIADNMERFFSRIDFGKMWEKFKEGFKTVKGLLDSIAKFIDDHPTLSKILGGVAVGAVTRNPALGGMVAGGAIGGEHGLGGGIAGAILGGAAPFLLKWGGKALLGRLAGQGIAAAAAGGGGTAATAGGTGLLAGLVPLLANPIVDAVLAGVLWPAIRGGGFEALGTWMHRLGTDRETAELKQESVETGYANHEDAADALGLGKKYRKGTLSREEQRKIYEAFHASSQATKGTRDTQGVRANQAGVAPAGWERQRHWGDIFREMLEETKRQRERPLKIEAKVENKHEVSVGPSPLFNVQMETYETLQSWRAIQTALS